MEVFSNTKENTASELQPLLRERHDTHEETVWRQYLAAFLASIVSLSSGCVGGWSSPATPQLLNGNASNLGGIRQLSIEEASWVASLINLGAFFGSIPAGYLSFRWGRKKCLLSLAIPIIVGWLFIIFNFNNVRILRNLANRASNFRKSVMFQYILTGSENIARHESKTRNFKMCFPYFSIEDIYLKKLDFQSFLATLRKQPHNKNVTVKVIATLPSHYSFLVIISNNLPLK